MSRARSRRRAQAVVRGMPAIHDREPPPWTGVPVERDPVTGKLLRGDPTGRADKGRADRTGSWKGPMIATGIVAVLAATFVLGWFVATRNTGGPDLAAATTAAGLSSTLPGTTTARSTAGRTTDPTTPVPTTTPSTPTTTTPSRTATTTPQPAIPPLPPADVFAEAVDQTVIRLTWTDQSTDESGFEITNDSETVVVDADAQHYDWTGLTAGQEMCFRIRAVGANGMSDWQPEVSPFHVCAKTLPPPPLVDLTALGIEPLEDSTICAYTSPTFRAYIGNAGSEQSGDFNIRWLVDGVQVFDGGHAGVPSGATDTHDHIWYDMTEGPHELKFIVDLNDHIAEFDEANNEFVFPFTAAACVG